MTLRVSCLWIRLHWSRCMILQAAFKIAQQKCFFMHLFIFVPFICAFFFCSVLFYFIIILCAYTIQDLKNVFYSFIFVPFICAFFFPMFFVLFYCYILCFFFNFIFFLIFSPSFIIITFDSASQTQYHHYCNSLVSNTSTSSVIVNYKMNSINVFPS